MHIKNYSKGSPHTGQNGHHQKNLQTISAKEGVEKRGPSDNVGGNVNYAVTVENSTEVLKKPKQNYHMTQQYTSWI